MKAAIFDLDNTLVDSLKIHEKAYLKIFKKYEIEYEKNKLRKLFGRSSKSIVQTVLDENNLDLDANKIHKEKQELYQKISKDSIELLPGAQYLLELLKFSGAKIGLASGGIKRNVYDAIEMTNISGYFDVVYTGSDVSDGKPDPEIFQKTAKKLKVKPKDCIVFEDSFYGVEAAKKSDMFCVAVATGVHTKDDLSEADLVLDELSDFIEVFHNYFGKKSRLKWIKICPQCQSENVSLFIGGHTGQNQCKDCGFVGFVLEVEKEIDS